MVETTWLIGAVIALHVAAGSVAWLIIRDLIRSDGNLPRGDGGAWRWQPRLPTGGRPRGDHPAGAPTATRIPARPPRTVRDAGR